jgi:hypothetical protein
LVEAVAPQTAEEYKKKSGKKLNMTVDKNIFLPPGPERATSQLETW